MAVVIDTHSRILSQCPGYSLGPSGSCERLWCRQRDSPEGAQTGRRPAEGLFGAPRRPARSAQCLHERPDSRLELVFRPFGVGRLGRGDLNSRSRERDSESRAA